MIASFFQSLETRGVEYLLISGQATVLYGASTFSEDIDLWINPALENRDRFVDALRACGACHYKLSPPLTVEHLERGHGFHYLQSRMARLQKADRDYWRPIIAELKRFRSQGLLAPEGQPV